jgi:predicted DNA-binding transcriptional regulator AlpA
MEMKGATMTGTERPAVAAVVDVPTAASMLGIGRTLAYHLVRTGQWPTPLIRVGRLIKVPTRPLLEYVDGGARDGAQTVRL